ncbi:MAG TPA: hypothetical protein VNP04_27540 [Alphaproteobacteria bacterium]|nr:hypothetical protein [Alphaproteobacteria bacterium]
MVGAIALEDRVMWRMTASLSGLLLSLTWLALPALAHEERLIIGQVQAIDLQKHLLTVQDPERERIVRLTVDGETEVKRCRQGLPLTALRVGVRVRVKYLDRPGDSLEALSILILADHQ